MEAVLQCEFLHYQLCISKSHMEQKTMWKADKVREETLCYGFVAPEHCKEMAWGELSHSNWFFGFAAMILLSPKKNLESLSLFQPTKQNKIPQILVKPIANCLIPRITHSLSPSPLPEISQKSSQQSSYSCSVFPNLHLCNDKKKTNRFFPSSHSLQLRSQLKTYLGLMLLF